MLPLQLDKIGYTCTTKPGKNLSNVFLSKFQILFCAVLATSLAEPDPKKFKLQEKKNKLTNATLTADERKFLREVEAKFGIKPDGTENDKKDEKEEKISNSLGDLKLPFPAVIAIEIVNDTDSKTKGKRTIDANLGYGYKTNNGYSYSYFGKPGQDKGKFMIYPYSQEDLPSGGHGSSSGNSITHVEIQPSKAFELVSVKDENEGYNYPKPSNGLSTSPSYSHGHHSQGASQSHNIPSTLYTTYNGHEFSGLSGKFPTVMPNYFVDPSQLLKTPEYQSVGLTNDHLRLPPSQSVTDHRVVPVLVLRVPSSSLKNPTAELFANLPSNYPLSRYLNNVNLQELVNQYFKKMGFSFAPPVMHYQTAIGPTVVDTPSYGGASSYGRQHYAAPYVQPSYTHADHSGVQYSAVQPVMAKYPSTYPQRYTLSHGHSLYQQPMHQQRYEYQYQYVPRTAAVPQTYYTQSQYQQQSHEAPASVPETSSYVTSAEVEHETSPQVSSHDTGTYEYRTPQVRDDDEATKAAAYEYIQQGHVETGSYGKSAGSETGSYESPAGSDVSQEYQTHEQVTQNEAIASYPSQADHSEETSGPGVQIQSHAEIGHGQSYQYQQQSSEESDGNNLVLSENYPSKDHTIATVFPVSYNSKLQNQNTGTVQTVSYVTPMPYSSIYQSQYRIMVPQTFLGNPTTEKVAYVNSHSVSAFTHPSQQEYNSEAEYTVGPHYVPPISKQKPPSYPRNYHSHPKRMAKPDSKSEITISHSRKHNDHKKSS